MHLLKYKQQVGFAEIDTDPNQENLTLKADNCFWPSHPRRIMIMVKREKGLPSFLQNGQRLVASVKTPEPPSKEGLLVKNTAEEAESAQQPNLDQDKHDKWLESRTPEQLDRLASRLGALARSKEKSGKLSSQPESSSKTSLPD
jgi:hypothetical protein